MKISQLFEFVVDEAFSDMDQKAKNIQAGKGNATDAELRQQRISQLAANQKARNAAPAGKPMTAPAGQTAAAPATAPADATAAANTTAPADQTQQAAPATGTPAPAGAKGAVTGLANTVGAVSKGLGAVGGGIAGAFNKIKQGYQAGKGAVGGTQAPAQGGTAPATAPAGATPADNAEIAQLVSRVSALEKAVGIAESYKFESKFLKMDI
jgi:hypothetical protein